MNAPIGKDTQRALVEVLQWPIMASSFQLFTEAPEGTVLALGCRMALPDEETLATELAARRGLDPADVRVAYSVEDGQRYVSVYRRIVRLIDCATSAWIATARNCFKERQPFDLLNATPADLDAIDKQARADADSFRWSDESQAAFKRRYRPLRDEVD